MPYAPAIKAAARQRYEAGVDRAVILQEAGISENTLRYWIPREHWQVQSDAAPLYQGARRYAAHTRQAAKEMYLSGISLRLISERLGPSPPPWTAGAAKTAGTATNSTTRATVYASPLPASPPKAP